MIQLHRFDPSDPFQNGIPVAEDGLREAEARISLRLMALAMLTGYFLGSIPFGFLAGKWRGIDLQKEGSGNIGATNALRILGKSAGIAVLFLDILKGSFACWIALNWIAPNQNEARILAIIAGVSAILGHNFSCWLKFKGGKGIATSAGVLLVLSPWSLAISFLVFLGLLMMTRIVSIASIAAAIVLPFATWITGEKGWMLAMTTLMGLVAIYQHRSNIRRLWNRSEARFDKKTR